jgi:hypothetical protein
MAWRNRITGMKNRPNSFRKLNIDSYDEVEDDTPLLVQSSSSFTSSPISVRHCSPNVTSLGFSKTKSLDTTNSNSNNIAAVPDEIEALSFREDQQQKRSFVAQFEPNNVMINEEENGDTTTIFDDDNDDDNVNDDHSSNDGSMYTEDCKEGKETHDVKSLRAPSITGSEKNNEEDNISRNYSTTNSKSSKRSRNRNYNDEDADAATWNADEVDAFVDVNDFGNRSGSRKVPPMMMTMQPPTVEISGVDLLLERDSSVNELQEVSHLMTFNALVLIQKQKDWIEGSSDATNGANKGSSSLITMELENLERKIKLLMDHKAWPNERERIKQERDPLTPSKAFFKSMALIDKSIEQFHKGYLKFMSNTSEENHELKTRVDELETLNASLQDEASRSRQKTATIRNLQQERDDLTRKVERTDERLASLVKSKVIIVDNETDNITASSSPNSNKESNFHCVKSYIHKLEVERERHLAEIQLLKSAVESKNSEDSENESSSAAAGDDADENRSLDDSLSTTTDDIKINNEIILDHDLGSRWHTLQENEEATALAASKEQQVNKLCAKVAERESALISIRSECKLMRMQLLQLETNRNEYKSQCDSKDSALAVSQDRIANLEDEVLRTHARCATYEEDYEALKESFVTQKLATNQELNNSQLDVKTQIESIRTEFEEKLQHTEGQLIEVKLDRERLIRDLKLSVEEIELERDSLQSRLAENVAAELSFAPITQDNFNEEKKESEDLPSEDIVAFSEAQRLMELEKDLENFNRMRGRVAEKASEQTFTIATLQEENDMKEQQLKSLNEMVEHLLGKNGKDGEEGTTDGSNNRPWGHKISNLRDRSQRKASELLSRSRHGSMHGGSRHGSSMHSGSRHGDSMHGCSRHGE